MMARFASTARGLVIFKGLQLSPPVNTYSELGTSLPQLPTLAAGLYLSARCFPVLLGDDGDSHGTILRKDFPKGTPVSSGRRQGTPPRTGKCHVVSNARHKVSGPLENTFMGTRHTHATILAWNLGENTG